MARSADVFESGTLAGWTQRACTGGGHTVAPSMAAAHRGMYGVKLTDGSASETCIEGQRIARLLPSTATDVYSRVWVRQPVANATGFAVVFRALWAGFGETGAAHGWEIDATGRLRVNVHAFESDGGFDYQTANSTAFVRDGGWNLLEASTFRRGTANATATYRVNGVLVGQQTMAGFANRYDELMLGELFFDKAFQGQVAFDDVRADTVPLASRFAIVPSVEPITAGSCTPVVITLAASLTTADGGVRPAPLAPYSVVANISGAPVRSGDDSGIDPYFNDRAHWAEGTRPSEWEGPDKVTENKRFWEVFEACLYRLPEASARIFTMREVLGFDTDEICATLGITSNNCWVQLHRARLALRACLGVNWFGEAA